MKQLKSIYSKITVFISLLAVVTVLLSFASCDIFAYGIETDTSIDSSSEEQSGATEQSSNKETSSSVDESGVGGEESATVTAQTEEGSEHGEAAETETEVQSTIHTESEMQTESQTEEDPQYTKNTLPFVAHCDFLGEETVGKTIHSKSNGKCVLKGYSTDEYSILAISGWCIIEGGVSKYVWSIDGGKTWNDIGGYRNYGNEDMINAAQSTLNYTFESDFTVLNAHFQGCGTLKIDLYEYSGEKVNVIIGAVPLDNEASVAILFYVSNLQCN